VVFGVAAPFVGEGIHRLAVWLRARIEPRMLLLMPVAGAVIGGIAIGFAEVTDHEVSDVLFSGQSGLGPLVDDAASWSVGALLLVMLCKGLAYSISLSSFRGGPIFPALYIGAAAGIAASHLPGMELVPGVAMGIGAMSTVMLKLPLTSALFPTILLGSEGAEVVPVTVIAVVIAYAVSIRLAPAPTAEIAHSG
jgi:hypothetical protein